MTAEARLPNGTILDGKWRIESQLGQGGMGSVYAAVHVRNGARVAVKILHEDVARDSTARVRFLQEGYAANRVGHPGVVRVLDDGTTPDGVVYLVMERLEGVTLESLAESAGGVLPPLDVVRHSIAWLDVMAAAHAQGIIHRDLKPENVFVCVDGRLKVLDFGLARSKEAVSQLKITTTGVPLGTPAFMPPEQALAHWDEVDTRSDVYAIGASMFTLLTGQLVHEGRTVPELIVNISTKPARPIRSVAPQVPDSVAAVIDRALSSRPADRFADAREMLTALSEAALRRSLPSATFEAPTSSAAISTDSLHTAVPKARPGAGIGTNSTSAVSTGSIRRRRTTALSLALLFLLGAVVTLSLVLYRSRPKPQASEPEAAATVTTPASESDRGQPGPPPPETVTSPLVVPASSSPVASAAGAATGSLPSASASTAPSTKPPARSSGRPRPPPPPPAKPCVRDTFTQRCPCASCP